MEAPDLTGPSRALKVSSMTVELVNSNHNSESGARDDPLAAVLEGLSGLEARLREDLAEVRRLRALAAGGGPARTISRQSAAASDDAASDSKSPRLWTVRQLAKQMGISEKAARRLARSRLMAVCTAPSHCCGCFGGTRGCDLRFIAADASAWVSRRRSAQ